MNSCSDTVAIISHDAGGAELISSMVYHKKLKCKFSLGGPAKKIFEKKIGSVKNLPFREAINKSNYAITGTGWATDLEYNAIKYAKDKQIPVIAYLDHYVNYKERFIRNDLEILPNQFWVTDKYSFDICKNIFPSTKLKIVDNFYLKDQLSQIKKIDDLIEDNLLYILEPTRNKWGKNKLGEFQALDYFLSKLSFLNLPRNTKINLRPHPSDKFGKYDSWIKERKEPFKFLINESLSLNESISKSKWIVGCESYALVIAIEAGRKVFTSLPSWAHECRLPQKKIVKMKNLK